MTEADGHLRGRDSTTTVPVIAPVLSVVVPTRNRSSLLAGALASVDRIATDRLHVEKIVVDDGSTDDTPLVAAGYGVRLLRSPGRGASAARNAGMAAATGEFLLFLDDDDQVVPDQIGRLVGALQADPDLGAAFGQVQLADERLEPFGDPYPQTVSDPIHYVLGNWQQIGSVVVRTAVRDTVGQFDASLIYSQDWDWLLRVLLWRPAAFVAIPCMLFRQRPSGTADAMSYHRLAFMRRAFWRNVRRAGDRRPAVHHLLRMYARHNGNFAAHFLLSLKVHSDLGDAAGSRVALHGAFMSSPLHAALGMARQPHLLGMALRSYLPGASGKPRGS
jgi:glycosyltransferase involved in cell wall biosynthesis